MTVTEYITSNKKPEDIIKTSYVPYATKINTCERIVLATTSNEINNIKIFKVNTPAQYLIYTLNMIDQYTDIDINFNDNITEQYDELQKNNVLSEIINTIPQSEVVEYQTILDMVRDDYLENNRNIVSFLETKFESIKVAFDSLGEVLNSDTVQTILAGMGGDNIEKEETN